MSLLRPSDFNGIYSQVCVHRITALVIFVLLMYTHECILLYSFILLLMQGGLGCSKSKADKPAITGESQQDEMAPPSQVDCLFWRGGETVRQGQESSLTAKIRGIRLIPVPAVATIIRRGKVRRCSINMWKYAAFEPLLTDFCSSAGSDFRFDMIVDYLLNAHRVVLLIPPYPLIIISLGTLSYIFLKFKTRQHFPASFIFITTLNFPPAKSSFPLPFTDWKHQAERV